MDRGIVSEKFPQHFYTWLADELSQMATHPSTNQHKIHTVIWWELVTTWPYAAKGGGETALFAQILWP